VGVWVWQMQAERNLMEVALQQPLNERFVLLSETCIPLYPATLVWAQLLSQPRSRIHACAVPNNSDDEGRRMTYRCVHFVHQPRKLSLVMTWVMAALLSLKLDPCSQQVSIEPKRYAQNCGRIYYCLVGDLAQAWGS